MAAELTTTMAITVYVIAIPSDHGFVKTSISQ